MEARKIHNPRFSVKTGMLLTLVEYKKEVRFKDDKHHVNCVEDSAGFCGVILSKVFLRVNCYGILSIEGGVCGKI
jgi:hypothetical protein